MKRAVSTTLVALIAALGLVGVATPANAADPALQSLDANVDTTTGVDGCRYGSLSVGFFVPRHDVVKFSLEIKTARGTIKKSTRSHEYAVWIEAGCVSKAFVKDVEAKKLKATVYAYTTSGSYAGKRSVRITWTNGYC
jgi:hypothetical protein